MPETQLVPPLKLIPPHCPHLATAPETGVDDAAGTTTVESVVAGEVGLDAAGELAGGAAGEVATGVVPVDPLLAASHTFGPGMVYDVTVP